MGSLQMTTIAWDGKTLASDSRQIGDYVDQCNVTKIFTVGSSYLGLAGDSGKGQIFLRWYKDQTKPRPDQHSLDGFEALIIKGSRTYYVDKTCELIECGKPAAIGSGCDCAMGAMLAGATAIEAVKIAIKLDQYSGGKVRSIKVK